MYMYVCLLNRSQLSLVLVDNNQSYINLGDIIIIEFGLNSTKVAASLKYVLNDDLPIEKRKRSFKEGKPIVKRRRYGGHSHNHSRCSSLVLLSQNHIENTQ